jgi:hypothetical protein
MQTPATFLGLTCAEGAEIIDRMTAKDLRAFLASTNSRGRLRALLAYARDVQTQRVRSGNLHSDLAA